MLLYRECKARAASFVGFLTAQCSLWGQALRTDETALQKTPGPTQPWLQLDGVQARLLAPPPSFRLIADGREEKASILIYNLFLLRERRDCSSPCCQAVSGRTALFTVMDVFGMLFFVAVCWGKALQGQK